MSRLSTSLAALIASLYALIFVPVLAFAGTYRTDNITSETGGPVGLPAGLTVPTTAVGNLVGSTAALTLAAGANVAAVVTPVTLNYIQIGTTVIAYGQVSIDPTSDDTLTVFTLTLPVPRVANFSGTGSAVGFAGKPGMTNELGTCSSTNSAKTVTCGYYANGTAVELINVMFTYTIS